MQKTEKKYGEYPDKQKIYDMFLVQECLESSGIEELLECKLGYHARYVKETSEQILKCDVIL